MKRKQFLALMMTMTLLAGSNMTAITSLAASRAAAAMGQPVISQNAQAGTGMQAENGEEEDSSGDAALEKAITDAVGQVSTGAAKEETVYIFADAYGKQRDITVSNWLKNPEKKDTIEDESVLQEIENVKGDETFSRDGSRMNPYCRRSRMSRETRPSPGTAAGWSGRPTEMTSTIRAPRTDSLLCRRRSPIIWTGKRLQQRTWQARAAR